MEVSIQNDGHTITYVASRAINVGEELIVSYGHKYFRRGDYSRFECGMPAISVAAARGDAEGIRVMVADNQRRGKDTAAALVNVWAHGWTPLHEASNRGHVEAANVLLAAGARVDQTDTAGLTPVYAASQMGHAGVVNVLIAAGATVDHPNRDDGTTPLFIASQDGHVEVAKVLLAAGASVEWAMPDGWTALMSACRDGHRDVAVLLLDRGAGVGQADKEEF